MKIEPGGTELGKEFVDERYESVGDQGVEICEFYDDCEIVTASKTEVQSRRLIIRIRNLR